MGAIQLDQQRRDLEAKIQFALDGARLGANHSRAKRNDSLVTTTDNLHVFDVLGPESQSFQHPARSVVAGPADAVDADLLSFEIRHAFDSRLNDKLVLRRFAAGDDDQIRAHRGSLGGGFEGARVNRDLSASSAGIPCEELAMKISSVSKPLRAKNSMS